MVINSGTLGRAWLATSLILPFVRGQCSGTTTISTSAEATALAECETFDGDLVVAKAEGEVSLDGLNQVTGDLTASVVNDLTAVTADSLQTVGGQLSFRYADSLATVRLPVLRNIGSLSLLDLPSLRVIDAGEDGFTNVSSVTIRRTALENVDWLRPDTVDDIRIEENLNLTEVTLGGLSLVKSYLTLSNVPGVSFSMPDLKIAYNVSVEGCDTVNLPSLSRVNRSISFIGNSIQRLELAKLQDVGGQLMLWNNSALSTVSLPILANVSGDVVISANPELNTPSFPELSIVKGDISANGSFSKFDMPSLTDVQGDVVIRSEVALDCAPFDSYNQQHVLKARYICEAGAAEPDSEPNSPAARGLSTGAKAGIAIGVVAGIGLLVTMAFLFWRKSKRSREAHSFNNAAVTGAGKEIRRTPSDVATTSRGANEYTKPELVGESVPKATPELHGDSSTRLMDPSSDTAEFEGDTPRFELPASTPANGR